MFQNYNNKREIMEKEDDIQRNNQM